MFSPVIRFFSEEKRFMANGYQKVRAWRKRAKLTKQQAAAKAEMPISQLYKIENEKIPITALSAKRLAKAMKIEPVWYKLICDKPQRDSQ
jgi:transcriptional regulator with XRE-family HTH domain